jgi:hypothetical protein
MRKFVGLIATLLLVRERGVGRCRWLVRLALRMRKWPSSGIHWEKGLVNDNSNASLEARFTSRLLDALLIEFVPLLVWGTFIGLGAAWCHYVGPLSGYFLALITFGLAALVIGTVVYAAYQMRRGRGNPQSP